MSRKKQERTEEERISELLVQFKVPTVAKELIPRLVSAGPETLVATVLEVLEAEAEDRRGRRIERLRRASHLPGGKTVATLDQGRLPRVLREQFRELLRGDFLDRAVNVLCFGLPGTGKSHVGCALGHALVEAGHAVLFTPTYQLVQELLAAKQTLTLPRALRKLDVYELIVLD